MSRVLLFTPFNAGPLNLTSLLLTFSPHVLSIHFLHANAGVSMASFFMFHYSD